MLRRENLGRKACVGCSAVSKERRNCGSRFTGFQNETALRGMYLNVKNQK